MICWGAGDLEQIWRCFLQKLVAKDIYHVHLPSFLEVDFLMNCECIQDDHVQQLCFFLNVFPFHQPEISLLNHPLSVRWLEVEMLFRQFLRANETSWWTTNPTCSTGTFGGRTWHRWTTWEILESKWGRHPWIFFDGPLSDQSKLLIYRQWHSKKYQR